MSSLDTALNSDTEIVPVRHSPDNANLGCILELIQTSFAYMHDQIDPPSSMHKLTVDSIAQQCSNGEVWSLGDPINACVFLTINPDSLFLGKLAVAENMRRRGLAQKLVRLAEERARQLDKQYLELYTRIELIENHRAFSSMGFVKVGEDRHAGYARSTYIQMRKPVVF